MCFRFFFALFLLFLLSLITEAQNSSGKPNYLSHFCSNDSTYTFDSRDQSIQTNLNLLLSALSFNATATNGFYNATRGESPNTVYGLFLCRGDVSASICQDCVAFATRDVIWRCPIENEVMIWYDECLLRYSGKSIFSILSNSESVSMWSSNSGDVRNATQFMEQVATAMNYATAQTVSMRKRFATKETKLTAFQTLYNLVQCTPDLSSSDCNRCLQGALADLSVCCSGRISGRVLYPSCYVRYEIYPFYNLSAAAVAPAAPAPPPRIVATPGSVINPEGKVEHIIYCDIWFETNPFYDATANPQLPPSMCHSAALKFDETDATNIQNRIVIMKIEST